MSRSVGLCDCNLGGHCFGLKIEAMGSGFGPMQGAMNNASGPRGSMDWE